MNDPYFNNEAMRIYPRHLPNHTRYDSWGDGVLDPSLDDEAKALVGEYQAHGKHLSFHRARRIILSHTGVREEGGIR